MLLFILAERSFKIVGDDFQLSGKPFRYISGSFHYFRQHPDYWEESIKKMANGGLNTICTYVAWNIHEPEKRQYCWDGFGDLPKFLDLCQKYNMLVILRPGPFICAEWEFGGFPYWLITDHVGSLRINNPKYLKEVDTWFGVLFTKLTPYLYKNGGCIISCQIENEYGVFYACDKAYLKHLCDLTKKYFGDIVLFTTDTGEQSYLRCGTYQQGAHATVDFATTADPAPRFENARKINGHGPDVDSEFYTGWIDHWKEPHHRVDPTVVAEKLDAILDYGASVNIYMYYGGTNFGYYAGANGDTSYYNPDPTSYDYDAPLSEAGDMTTKWTKIRDVIAKYRTDIPSYEVKNTTKRAYGKVTFTEAATFFEALPFITKKEVKSDAPLAFEEIPTGYGFVVYSTQTDGGELLLQEVHDRAIVYVNGMKVSTQFRNKEIRVNITKGNLDILVENFGRINLPVPFSDSKGLTKGATLDGQPIIGWTMKAVPLQSPMDVFKGGKLPVKQPAFYRALFNVDEPADTYLNPTGFVHGIAYVNGFNLGRYWLVGPQLTLYVPGPILKKGENDLIIFEIDGVDEVEQMSFDDTPKIDELH